MTLSAERNRELPKYVERFPELVDFYNTYDALDVTQEDVDKYESFAKKRKGDELEILGMETRFYVVDIDNLGGLPMPVILDVHYEDGEVEQIRVPAEIWRSNATSIQKLVMTDRDVARFVLDPRRETADGDLSNNVWPPEMDDRRFRVNASGSRDRGTRCGPPGIVGRRRRRPRRTAAETRRPASPPGTAEPGSGTPVPRDRGAPPAWAGPRLVLTGASALPARRRAPELASAGVRGDRPPSRRCSPRSGPSGSMRPSGRVESGEDRTAGDANVRFSARASTVKKTHGHRRRSHRMARRRVPR